jgi:flavodoxin/ferredoxin
MKSVVIWFSQTGNTEHIAAAIGEGIELAGSECDLVRIKDVNPKKLLQYDLIGLGAPVFHFGEPMNVKWFIDRMAFVGGKHAFAFCTHGTIPEYYFPNIVPRLKKRGLTVIGTKDWYCSCYLPALPKPYFTDGHPDEVDLQQARDFGREMVERSRRISLGETDLVPPVPVAPPPLPNTLQVDGIPVSFSSYVRFDKEKCTYPRCRLCMDNCPVDGIDLSMDPPVIAEPCDNCHFCANLCPTGALDDTGVAEKMERLMAGGMTMVPHLERAEAEGRFRRLVPVEKVGSEPPIYKVHNKHPRWVIGSGLQ